jgi:hypothetical protein
MNKPGHLLLAVEHCAHLEEFSFRTFLRRDFARGLQQRSS